MPQDESMRFVRNVFSKHYREAALQMPDRFSKREFGFMFFERPGMVRHTGFPTRASLKKYLADNLPAHVYYSSAYYEHPSAPTMAKKKWLGADLIFDLDADHIRGAKDLPFDQMLGLVKREVRVLLDEFILGDLGFDNDDVRVVFSGGRGYHVHVTTPGVTRLASHERREIVDYITATDLDIEWLFEKRPVEVARFKDILRVKWNRRMVKATDGGWRTKIRLGIEDLFTELDKLPHQDREGYLTETMFKAIPEVRRDVVVALCKDLLAGQEGERIMDSITDGDNLMRLKDQHLEVFVKFVVSGIAPKIAGETDEPVTSDIKRLIRLPSSLHGKTGFEVVPLSRDELDDFDPFVDAVPRSFGNNLVGVRLESPAEFRLRDQQFSLDAGISQVPEFAAVFLVCRRLATVERF